LRERRTIKKKKEGTGCPTEKKRRTLYYSVAKEAETQKSKPEFIHLDVHQQREKEKFKGSREGKRLLLNHEGQRNTLGTYLSL